MKKRTWLFVFVILLMASCNPVKNSPTPLAPTDAPVSVGTGTAVPENLALNKKVTASALTLKELAGFAVDGAPETQWGAGDSAPQWIQIDLQGFATITGIRLTVAQSPAGETTHQIFAGASPTDLKLIHEFNGATSDRQVIAVTFEEPIPAIRYIKVLTTKSPSWVAWREIEVLGYESGPPPTPAPGKEVADVIYINGQILTMEKDQPTAQAIAIKDDKILAVGNESDAMAFKGDATQIIDLNGLTLTPGFIDSHVHRIGDRWQFGDVSAEQMMDKALSQGWTSIHELFVNDQRLAELENLARANAMPMRVSMYLTMNFHYDYSTWWQAYQPLQQFSPYLQIAGLKITLDQEWGETIFFDQNRLNQMVMDAYSRGWQVATHSFSPRANELILNAYGNALNGGPNEPYRFRLEHTGVMTDAEVQKMADLGIIGSVQFINASSWVEDASFKKYIPADEVQHSARWRDLIDAGVFLIGNTDDPWCCTDWRNGFKGPSYAATVVQALYQAVTRTTYTGKQPEPWQVAQAVTVQEALAMLTINGAYAAHQEDVVGSLKAGKYADMVILSANPLTTPIGDLPAIQVVMTMVGGDVKYCAPGYAEICQP
jgi:predicted amidohydrolase YtcJ